jgi:hypothetical protein
MGNGIVGEKDEDAGTPAFTCLSADIYSTHMADQTDNYQSRSSILRRIFLENQFLVEFTPSGKKNI